MKVLLLPFNTASDLSHKVQALRALGIEARGLAIGGDAVQSAEGIRLVTQERGRFVSNRARRLFFAKQMYDAIKWADILHWGWDFGAVPFRLDKHIVRKLDKPGVIQWAGSDIRIPETDLEINPFYKHALQNGYEHRSESLNRSMRNQRDFASVGFFPLVMIGLEHYIDRDLFPEIFHTYQSVVLADHDPAYPDPASKRPLIIHSPTAPNAKGTQYVLKAIDVLRARYDLDFQLVQNIPRDKALGLMRQCDMYVDQLISGSHGSAAVEAMAFGKPVVTYINPVIGKDYPADLPIVNADPTTIVSELEKLIANAPLRHDLGRKGRAYVERYHDDTKIGRELVEVYEEVLQRHKKGYLRKGNN